MSSHTLLLFPASPLYSTLIAILLKSKSWLASANETRGTKVTRAAILTQFAREGRLRHLENRSSNFLLNAKRPCNAISVCDIKGNARKSSRRKLARARIVTPIPLAFNNRNNRENPNERERARAHIHYALIIVLTRGFRRAFIGDRVREQPQRGRALAYILFLFFLFFFTTAYLRGLVTCRYYAGIHVPADRENCDYLQRLELFLAIRSCDSTLAQEQASVGKIPFVPIFSFFFASF